MQQTNNTGPLAIVSDGDVLLLAKNFVSTDLSEFEGLAPGQGKQSRCRRRGEF